MSRPNPPTRRRRCRAIRPVSIASLAANVKRAMGKDHGAALLRLKELVAHAEWLDERRRRGTRELVEVIAKAEETDRVLLLLVKQNLAQEVERRAKELRNLSVARSLAGAVAEAACICRKGSRITCRRCLLVETATKAGFYDPEP